MGVVKNLIVRIGVDARGLVSGMNTSSNATSRASEKMKKSTTDLKNTTRQNFGGAKKSVREYAQYVANLKQSHQTATQSIPMLKDKLSQMESVFQSVKTATAGLDLSKPLETQILEAENNLVKIESKAKEVEQKIAALGNSRSRGSSAKMTELQSELNMLGEKSKYAQLRLEHLNQVADSLGSVHIGFASDAGLKTLAADISTVKNQLLATEAVANDTGQKLRSMGVAPTLKYALKGIGKEAASAAGGGIKKLWQGLKNIAGTAVKGIASLPGKLLGIGRSASSGAGGISKLVRSIRNIGIVSLGLRVASGLFGQLRSIISSYVSQNDTLNASVTSLKNQLGEALAPAINLVISLMQKLMPVVTSVANALNAVFSALFGNVAATTAEIQASASAAGSAASSLETYGFDQITKVSEPSGGGGGSSSTGQEDEDLEQSAIIQNLTGWITKLKEAFKKGDWRGVGEILGEGINGALDYAANFDFSEKAGTVVDNIVEAIGGFAGTVKWGEIADGLVGGISGVFDTVADWLINADTAELGRSINDAFVNGFYIDWESLFTSVFRGLGAGLSALISTIFNTYCGALEWNVDYFREYAEDAGGDVAQGMLDGALDGFRNIGIWIWDNICTPFVDGFKDAFDIHSPSRLMKTLGGYLIDGLFVGLTEKWRKILTAISEWASDVTGIFTGAWSDCKQTTSQQWSEIFGTVTTNASEISKVSKEKFAIIETAISSSLAGARKKAGFEMTSLQGDAAKAWEAMKADATKSASDIGSYVPSSFERMKTGVLNVFKNMSAGIKGWINEIIGGVEMMINMIIAGLNSLISKFNNNSLMALVEKFTGQKIIISSLAGVSLPRLAKGTIVDGPTAAIIGESGKEAVMPLENHTGWIDNLADRIASRNGGAGVPVILQIYIGKRKLTDYVIEDINKITDTTGVCPIRV